MFVLLSKQIHRKTTLKPIGTKILIISAMMQLDPQNLKSKEIPHVLHDHGNGPHGPPMDVANPTDAQGKLCQ